MARTNHNNQSGFALIIIIALVGLVLTVGAYAAVRAKQASEDKKALAMEQAADDKAKTNKKSPTPAPSTAPSATPAPTSTPTPVPTKAPTPVPTPRPNITPYKASDCTGQANVTVWVSNKNGTAGSYKAPNQWTPVITFAYGQQLSSYCQPGGYMPEYVLVNDAYVKSADLSTTKP